MIAYLFISKIKGMNIREYQGDLSKVLFVLIVIITLFYCMGR